MAIAHLFPSKQHGKNTLFPSRSQKLPHFEAAAGSGAWLMSLVPVWFFLPFGVFAIHCGMQICSCLFARRLSSRSFFWAILGQSCSSASSKAFPHLKTSSDCVLHPSRLWLFWAAAQLQSKMKRLGLIHKHATDRYNFLLLQILLVHMWLFRWCHKVPIIQRT